MARNRQRRRTPRPAPGGLGPGIGENPLFPQGAGGGEPPIQDDAPVAFAEGDDDDFDAASAAFGRAEPAAAAAVAAEQQRPSGNRVIGFLRASWAELQRVQWPDRQQVAQATGVVLGFVVITGIFLGISDYLAGKLINFII
jgi:preprotein translocase SecE subunit